MRWTKTENERFWDKVDTSGECWEWKASLNTKGYGHMWFRGRIRPSHQISWVLHNGEYEKGIQVLHSCDNRKCIRPDHLFLGTHQENMADMVRKGRQRSARGRAILSPHDVLSIRAAISRGEERRRLAARYGVSVSAVHHIASKYTRGHIPDEP